MAKNTIGYFYKQDTETVTSFANSDGNNYKQVAAAAADGSHVFEIEIASTDSVARTINFYKSQESNPANVASHASTFPIRTNQGVPASTGYTAGSPIPTNLINTSSGLVAERKYDRDQNFYISLPVGWYLYAAISGTAVSTGTAVKVKVDQKDF